VRRSRLRELGVGGAKFSVPGSELPVPVGATVQIPRNKKIKVSVTIKNTGSIKVEGTFSAIIFYADSLSNSSGNPNTDYNTWYSECEEMDFDTETDISIDAGATYTFTNFMGVQASSWDEETTIDAGVIVAEIKDSTVTPLDSLKITDAVEIIAPVVGITNVSFFEA